MADILKITSPIAPRENIHNTNRQIPTEGVFDLTNPNVIIKAPPSPVITHKNQFEQGAMAHLSKELLGPLLKNTDALLDTMRKIVLMINNTSTTTGTIPKEFLEKLFIKPEQMLESLITNEKNETAFGGPFFDILRLMAKLDNQPRLNTAIVSVLKYFDCFINKENTLDTIIHQGKSLPNQLFKTDRVVVEEAQKTLGLLVENKGENSKEIIKFLKNEYIPVLRQIVQKYNQDQSIRNQVMGIIHNIVRVDKGEPKRLEDASSNLVEELKALTNLSDKDLVDLKVQLMKKATESKPEVEDKDVATLISKALEKSEPIAINRVAHTLLTYLVQSESPVLPIAHYVMPIDFHGDKTYVEFFVDKDCKERKGDAKDSRNIFFTIQSEKHGTFEVDLLARDQYVELFIKCPENLLENVKNIKTILREKIEGQGYRLAAYQVGPYKEGLSILERFPKFAIRKAGINVKV